MGFLKNLFALVGALAIAAGLYGYVKLAPVLAEFDPGYQKMYSKFASDLLTSKDPGVAMMWVAEVKPDISIEDVKESLKSLAAARSFLFVGEAPFYKQVQALTGEPYRHISFMSFCDASVGKMMADYRDEYTGFMPCRISVVQGKDGKIRLYSMNLDMMIYGGRELPPELKKQAMRVSNVIREIMQGAAQGEF
ncbi:hypothetical protein Mmc1_2994 [Magnetococcus marinus MC-1]|uniref:DUF302 domain-containing protein n=1 Tax=Magnetococcus marinus (strain ATCC BAA-1437 / JCM 17883 / MC-1) TaxID=156889 RepID=A0LBZ2_MAGMM|nr:DUF302 domain-containing protein [Magnetococcus marinus]ABK45485.1 hypothetical protein Mmc1_2994 [Magnetococcus marinus MC-1]